ncbi:holo-ACP synthase [Corallococcus sp. BB11-1]|uniref:holo-ACP synthase n=1 Tax=Corallococcus sp. BB11-1 TaxID=2996783 RepID=UPI00226DEA09|nr:holo-ACP synthase [Corallococcus sp. BB11-1]MCY1035382.1 holo-ACP synthase [Corallococcus sp. BB11-1]
MVIGIGVDLCEIDRLSRALQRDEGRFEARVFTPAERAYCRKHAQPGQHFAARFAAKEAVIKALGAPEGLRWHEMEVLNSTEGKPELKLSGATHLLAARLGIRCFHVSLSHTAGFAIAMVVAEDVLPTAGA